MIVVAVNEGRFVMALARRLLDEAIETQAAARERLVRIEERFHAEDHSSTAVHIVQQDELVFSNDEARRIWEACQDVRAQMNAVMLIQVTPLSSRDLENLPAPSIEQVSGGISFAIFGDVVVLQIPTTTSYKQSICIINGLDTIYRSTGSQKNWVVDFSGVRSFPSRAWWSLLGYRSNLASRGLEFSIVWLREEAVGNLSLAKIVKDFSLRRRAGHWFSSSLLDDELM